MKRVIFLLCVVLFVSSLGFARRITSSSNLVRVVMPNGLYFYASHVPHVQPWPNIKGASWIWAYPYQSVVPVAWFGPWHFQEKFYTKKPLAEGYKYLLTICADNSYTAYVNGQLVGAALGVGPQQLLIDGQQEGKGKHLWATPGVWDITPAILDDGVNVLDVYAVNWDSYLDWTGHRCHTGVGQANPAGVIWKIELVEEEEGTTEHPGPPT